MLPIVISRMVAFSHIGDFLLPFFLPQYGAGNVANARFDGVAGEDARGNRTLEGFANRAATEARGTLEIGLADPARVGASECGDGEREHVPVTDGLENFE